MILVFHCVCLSVCLSFCVSVSPCVCVLCDLCARRAWRVSCGVSVACAPRVHRVCTACTPCLYCVCALCSGCVCVLFSVVCFMFWMFHVLCVSVWRVHGVCGVYVVCLDVLWQGVLFVCAMVSRVGTRDKLCSILNFLYL